MIEILIGIVAGIISGFGMGGGTILVLLLSGFMNVPQHFAQATNLFFFIPTAIAAISVSIKQKLIDFNTTWIVSALGIIGAIVGSALSIKITDKLLRKCFGVFLGIIAIYEIYRILKQYIFKKKDNNK